jgi:hypothetical protein
MAFNRIIECFSRSLVPEYCDGIESSAVYTAHPFFVETFPGCSNRCLPSLLLNMDGEGINPTVLTSNIDSGQCVPKALTLT